MKERAVIFAEADRLRLQGKPCALATVVRINGSTYRRPGARMLIAPDGTTWGTISGGCLEQEVAQQALDALETSQPQVLPFDLSDDDLILGFGTGCNGIVHVLIEPLLPDTDRADPLDLLRTGIDDRQTGVLATIIGTPPSRADLLARRLLYLAGGTTHDDLNDPPLREMLLAAATQALEDDQPEIRSFMLAGGTVDVFFEIVRPPVRLVIFGSGHDVRPVISFAIELGWQILLVGRKPPKDLAARFPQANAHLFLMHPGQVQDYVSLDAQTAVVVMNHHYDRDKTLIGALLAAPVRYIGALGPRERTERMMAELRAENTTQTDLPFDKLHGPVGLDIGTETPEEIALSMIAEIQAVLHDRSGGSLRQRISRIHETMPVV